MELINQLSAFCFKPGRNFEWLPGEKIIKFDQKRIETDLGRLQLLHEVGHAVLGHQTASDESRYQLERDAWDIARVLALKFGIKPHELIIARQLKELRALGY